MDDELSRSSYLVRRKGSSRWYYRRRFPLHLAEFIGRKDFNQSTEKSDLADAKGQLGLMELRYRATVTEAEERLAEDARSGRPFAPRIFPSRPAARFPSTPSLPRLTEQQADELARRYFDEQLRELDGAFSDGMSDPEGIDELDASIDRLRDAEDEETQRWTYSVAAAILMRHGIAAEADRDAGRRLLYLIRRALLQLTTIQRARVAGDYSDQITDSMFRRSPPATFQSFTAPVPVFGSELSSISVAELIAAYEEDREDDTAKFTEKTKAKHQAAYGIIRLFFGADRPIAEIDRAMCRAFRDTLADLPPNFIKLAPEGTPLSDIVGVKGDDAGSLARSTQAGYLRALTRLMTFAKVEKLIADNPLAEPLQPKGEVVNKEDARDPYTLAQLQKIFSAPIYTGCVDDGRRFSKPRPGNIVKRSRFWLPLIGLFMGLRMGEILQLTRWHVQTADDGLPCVLIGDNMQVKTKASYRVVPIHDVILKCGFMAFVESKADELFDDVKKGSDEYQSTLFSKRYATFAKSLQLNVPGRNTCFHSFRHNFRDALRIPDMDTALAKEVFGHSRGGDVFDAYGSGARAEVLRPVVNRVAYDIDLSHLYVD